MDQSAVDYEQSLLDFPGTANGFPDMDNRGSDNRNGTADNMAWAAMLQEEAQDQLNNPEKYDISAIDIFSYDWESASGNLIVKVNG